MSTAEVQSGLEGVVAFATEIAEPDRAGGALRYRGVDIEELVGNVPFEQVWGLLVDGQLLPGMPPAEPHPLSVRSGDPRVDVQSALAMLAPVWGLKPLLDIDAEQARIAANGGRLAPVGRGEPYGVYDPDGRVIALVEERDGAARPLVVLRPA